MTGRARLPDAIRLDGFVCEGDTCTCFEDMVPGATCPKLDTCADPISPGAGDPGAGGLRVELVAARHGRSR